MATNDESIKKNISCNITKYREMAGLSQKELASKLQVTPSRVSNWEQGANCPTIDILFEVCKILNVSINDIYGVYPNSSETLSYEELLHIKKYRELDKLGQEHVNNILEWESQRVQMLATMQKQLADSKIVEFETAPKVTYTLPYLRKMASAGRGEYIFDSLPTDTIEVPACELSEKADFVIGVNGDSMEPTYYDGDRVYVEKATEILAGEIGIFITENDCFIKEAGVDHLISHNKKYPDIYTDSKIELLGRVLGKVEEN